MYLDLQFTDWPIIFLLPFFSFFLFFLVQKKSNKHQLIVRCITGREISFCFLNAYLLVYLKIMAKR